jgi:hypothetical protein
MGSREADHLPNNLERELAIVYKKPSARDIQVVPCNRTLLPNRPPLLLVIL